MFVLTQFSVCVCICVRACVKSEEKEGCCWSLVFLPILCKKIHFCMVGLRFSDAAGSIRLVLCTFANVSELFCELLCNFTAIARRSFFRNGSELLLNFDNYF